MRKIETYSNAIDWLYRKRLFEEIYSKLRTDSKSLPCDNWNILREGKCLLKAEQNTVSSVQSFSCVPLFATPWTVAHQAS